MESTSTELLERRVLEAAKAAEERNDPPSAWAVEASRFARESGAGGVPNLEMGRALVAGLCFSNNTPSFWKYLEQALASRLLCPLHVLSLLTPRKKNV
ncbi:Mediator of RNA polymerase II transcription subunit 33A [Acorus gramineus]|uniref:Mediator of RNA polymerase II transcription subunit 33A n=1 Tax=Acorus gramineus TaxID=55184 RepID=A0AAV9AKS7_ACOGR|nr:Mediator of RNA polymerase II transcription subunit 33A [Acorus gramineus]